MKTLLLSRMDIEGLPEFCRKWRIQELSVFGSALGENFGPESDFDILVSFDGNARWSVFDIVVMKDELEQRWGRRVDIVEKGALRNPWKKREILNNREVLYAA